VRWIPAQLVRIFARPYVAGESVDAAFDVAEKLRLRGLHTTLDLLAEQVQSPERARRNAATYEELVLRAAQLPQPFRPTVSVKLSSFTAAPLDQGGDGGGCSECAWALARTCQACGVGLTIDMESRQWTDFSLALFCDIQAAGLTQTGIVLQSRLNRTENDAAALPALCRVRLVIGIYNEPAEVALRAKPEMKERLLGLAGRLLARGHYVELATHDEVLIRRFLATHRGARDQFELQMLYGVPRQRLQDELVAEGIRTRIYVPFATSWAEAIAYLRRRLDEYPQMMLLVARNWASVRGA
jgi:proline dehydrogenase